MNMTQWEELCRIAVERDASSCHLWTGSQNGTGYCQIGVDGKKKYVHRIAFEVFHGSIPDRMYVDHICHTRNCVNPDHLRLATKRQNAENRAGTKSHTRIRNVTWVENKNKYRVRAVSDGNRYHAGYYSELSDAMAAARELRNKIFTHNEDRIERSIQ
jgi:hypothetical protein